MPSEKNPRARKLPHREAKQQDMGYFGLAQDQGLESLTPEEAIRQMEELEKGDKLTL